MERDRRTQVFVQRMADALGVRPHQVPAMFAGARPTAVRLNPLSTAMTMAAARADIESAGGGPLTPVEWCTNAYFLDNVAQTTAAIRLGDRGIVYNQNAASLLPVVALDPQPGERILDVAAAPGGKAFHIAARTGNQGELWCNDMMEPRARRMQELAVTYGVAVHTMTTHPAQFLDRFLPPQSFDRILLDVQCTGEGRVNLSKRNALEHWSEERLTEYSFKQTKMLAAAATLLRPGGVMVYSTCSISPEENEIPVSKALRRNPDLDLVAPPGVDPSVGRPGLVQWRGERLDPRMTRALRVVPSPRFEGFFVARLEKQAK